MLLGRTPVRVARVGSGLAALTLAFLLRHFDSPRVLKRGPLNENGAPHRSRGRHQHNTKGHTGDKPGAGGVCTKRWEVQAGRMVNPVCTIGSGSALSCGNWIPHEDTFLADFRCGLKRDFYYRKFHATNLLPPLKKDHSNPQPERSRPPCTTQTLVQEGGTDEAGYLGQGHPVRDGHHP